MTALRWGAATDVGHVRTNNEDTSLVTEDLFVVADGMGGHRAGEVASQVAVAALRANFVDHTVEGLRAAVQEANRAVFDQQAGDPDLEGMGTTVVAIASVGTDGDGTELAFASVGDSRIYRFRDGELEQITDDHTLVDEMVRDGRLTPEEARVHPRRHMITRALGIEPTVDVDAGAVEPFKGDRFVLCTDGLSDEVDDSRIASVLRRLDDPAEAAAELVRTAVESGGRDNVTVVIVDVTDDDDKAGAASAALAHDRSATAAHTDLAGFTTSERKTAAPTAEAQRRAAKAAREPRPRRMTWRVLAFVLAVVVVVGGAAGAVGWYARHTYYVGFKDAEVAIFKGKPNGALWFDPTLEQRTGIDRADVPSRFLARLDAGVEEGSLADAQAFVENVRLAATPTTTTTTTVPSSTSTP